MPLPSSAYRYDHDNRRIEARTGAQTTSFTWGMGKLLEEKQGIVSRPYERAGDLVISAGAERILHDGVDSAVGRTDAGGHLTAQSRLDAWGSYRSGEPGSNEPTPGFAGQSHDASLAISYAQQRWYAPELGRFLSEDPVTATPDRLVTGMGLGGFAYAGSNPARYRDAQGLFEEPIHGALTYHLSKLAGFTAAEAGVIALYAAGVDHNPHTLPADTDSGISGYYHSLDNGWSGTTTYFHFASFEDALDRANEQLGQTTKRSIWTGHAVSREWRTLAPGSIDLRRLGIALHTIEDVGFADAPGPHKRGIQARFSWKHPIYMGFALLVGQGNETGHPTYTNEDGSEGGSTAHTADQPWRNPIANKKELLMVYDLLVRAAKVQNPKSTAGTTDQADAMIQHFMDPKTKTDVKQLLLDPLEGGGLSYWDWFAPTTTTRRWTRIGNGR